MNYVKTIFSLMFQPHIQSYFWSLYMMMKFLRIQTDLLPLLDLSVRTVSFTGLPFNLFFYLILYVTPFIISVL